MKKFLGSTLFLTALLALPGIGRGGDGVLPLKTTGEGVIVGGPFPRPARQNFQVSITNFQELEAMNPSIRCRLATQPSDQVLVEGAFVVAGHAYQLNSLCRNAAGSQFEIFAQRAASGRVEKLKFDGQLVIDGAGKQTLQGNVQVQSN